MLIEQMIHALAEKVFDPHVFFKQNLDVHRRRMEKGRKTNFESSTTRRGKGTSIKGQDLNGNKYRKDDGIEKVNDKNKQEKD